jgi:MerR family mercuric resistance operon transcriptional regulator
MENTVESLTIGAFAKAAGVNVETIRFYQRKGCCPNRTSPTAAFAATARRTWPG